MLFLIMHIALLLIGVALAEGPAPAQGQTIIIQQPQQQAQPGKSGITNFDDRVFNVGDSSTGKPRTTKGAGGIERYYDEEPDYNSGQRREWLETCEAKKDDTKAYRKCYSDEKNKSRDVVRKKQLEVERDLNKPARNMPGSPSLVEEERRNPSFGGVEVEKDGD